VDKKEEAKFRRRAIRALPNEYLETMYGFIKDDEVYICAFMEFEHESSPVDISYDDDDLVRDQNHAQANGLTMLGTIHTHPDREDALYSESDARSCWETKQEIVFGICAISNKGKRRKCHVAYWPGVEPLPVTYVNHSRKKPTTYA
jgi:proteasome lid subunit RPN8/RPN11